MDDDNRAANQSYIRTKRKKDILPLQEGIYIVHHSLFSICLVFLKNYFYSMCMGVSPVHVSALCALCLQRPGEGTGAPGTGTINAVSHHMSAEN